MREHWLDKSPRFLFFPDLIPDEAALQLGRERVVGRFELVCAITPLGKLGESETATPLHQLLMIYGTRAKLVIELAVISGSGTGRGQVQSFWTELGSLMLAVCAQRPTLSESETAQARHAIDDLVQRTEPELSCA